jgi:hypothetical protein
MSGALSEGAKETTSFESRPRPDGAPPAGGVIFRPTPELRRDSKSPRRSQAASLSKDGSL